jgi:hypothetical protein
MSFSSEELDEFSRIFPSARRYVEAGLTYFLISAQPLPEGCAPEKVDVLFCPMRRDGYEARLFFAGPVQSHSTRNWNAQGVRILERNWYAFSWQIQTNGLSLVNLFGALLRALQ